MALPSLGTLTQLAEQKRLRFHSPLESAFQDNYFQNYLWINRIGMAVGLVLWCLFGIIDYFAMPVSYQDVWVVRYAVVAPIILFTFVLSFWPVYRHWMRPLTILVTMATGLAVISFVWMADPGEVAYYYYIFGLMVILTFMYTVPGAEFGNALWITGLLIAITPLAFVSRFDFLRNPTSIIVFTVIMAFLFTLGIVGLIGNYFFELSVRRNFIQQLIIQREEDRSNNLLLNILPEPIAERLKRGEVIADYYPAISILFVDIVNFTPLSADMPAAGVVHLLNHIFSVFDELTEARTLEKIKTVGDAYMVVSGMPIPRADHAQVMADLALDIQSAISQLQLPEAPGLQVRIGIHSGPVVAGVIGWRKFAYDLWGDTVNTASRMESHGLPGKIQVSETYYSLLQKQYIFERRGVIQIKGKGEMCTYWLEGKI